LKKVKIIKLLVYLLGFIGFVILCSLSKAISIDAWWYTIGASICGAMLWEGSDFINKG